MLSDDRDIMYEHNSYMIRIETVTLLLIVISWGYMRLLVLAKYAAFEKFYLVGCNAVHSGSSTCT
jgi:hypothetical protein